MLIVSALGYTYLGIKSVQIYACTTPIIKSLNVLEL
jgi:hypothetical protein